MTHYPDPSDLARILRIAQFALLSDVSRAQSMGSNSLAAEPLRILRETEYLLALINNGARFSVEYSDAQRVEAEHAG